MDTRLEYLWLSWRIIFNFMMLKTFFIKYKRKGICDIVKEFAILFSCPSVNYQFPYSNLEFLFYEGNSNVLLRNLCRRAITFLSNQNSMPIIKSSWHSSINKFKIPIFQELNSPYDACVVASADLTLLECLEDSDCGRGTCHQGTCRTP